MIKRFKNISIVLIIILISTTAYTNANTNKLETPKPSRLLIDGTLNKNISHTKNTTSSRFYKGGAARIDIVPISDEPFTHAYRVNILKNTKSVFEASIGRHVYKKIDKGEILLLRFAAKTLKGASVTNGDNAVMLVDLEQAHAPNLKTLRRKFVIDKKWKYYYIPAKAKISFKSGESQLKFQLGYGKQTLEIADISLFSYGTDGNIKELPDTPVRSNYVGQSPNASWRKEAKQRINKYRKANLNITVVNSLGEPVPNAKVHIAMQKHAFAFGSEINLSMILAKTKDGEIYRNKLKKYFDLVVFGNALKWKRQKTTDYKQVEKAIKWLHENNISVRGHNLVWARWNDLPKSLKKYKSDPSVARQKIATHIYNAVKRWRGQLIGWDVINEAYPGNTFLQDLKKDKISLMSDWFHIAHAADPKAQLFMNGDGYLHFSSTDHMMRAYLKWLNQLKENSPISGIGLESHFKSPLPSIDKINKRISMFAKTGLPIKMTEFDVYVPDKKSQADFTRDFYTICFSHPDVKAILMWGFWAGKYYDPRRAMFDKDWTPRPNFHAWHNLVFKKWWTDETLKTNNKGVVKTRGFLGNYKITVSAEGKVIEHEATLNKNGLKLSIIPNIKHAKTSTN